MTIFIVGEEREMDSELASKDSGTDNCPGRRQFIHSIGAASLAAMAPGVAQNPLKQRRKLKIGALAVGAVSFWSYSWGDLLNPHRGPVYKETLGTDLFNMEITHVWDVNPEEARKFADKVGAMVVERYDGMIGEVDGIAFGGYYEAPWQYLLARPYIEAGIPTYLSRPFAYSMRHLDNMLELAAKHNTPIMATDVYEHLHEVSTFKRFIQDVGTIESVHGNSLGNDYCHLFHIKWMVNRIFGYNVGKVSLLTDDPNACSYLVETYLFNGDEKQPLFPCTMTLTQQDLYSLTVYGSHGVEGSRLPQVPDWQRDLLVHHVPMLTDMQRMFEGKNHESFDIVRKKTELFLTGFYSAVERGGAFVDVGSVPMDWHATPIKPDWINESMFRK